MLGQLEGMDALEEMIPMEQTVVVERRAEVQPRHVAVPVQPPAGAASCRVVDALLLPARRAM